MSEVVFNLQTKITIFQAINHTFDTVFVSNDKAVLNIHSNHDHSKFGMWINGASLETTTIQGQNKFL
jgi:hypothetical protein